MLTTLCPLHRFCFFAYEHPFTYIQIWLSQRSEVTLLRGYGPTVPVELIERLCRAFAELRAMNDAGAIAYPYSTRELVNVVVHVQAYVHITSQHFASHDNASSVPLVAGIGQPQRQRRPLFLGRAGRPWPDKGSTGFLGGVAKHSRSSFHGHMHF